MIIFLHGYLESSDIWNQIVDAFEEQIFCIDLLGHGKNPIVEFKTIQDMGSDVLAKVKELDPTHYSIVGHSMGGYVALDILERDPRCQKVLLLNSNFWEDSVEKKRDRERVVEAVRHNKSRFIKEVIPNLFADATSYSEMVEKLIQQAEQMSESGISNASLAMRDREDKTDLVKARTSDVIIVQGLKDTVMPIETMKQNLPQGVAMEILNTGHMSWCEAPSETTELIRKYLGN